MCDERQYVCGSDVTEADIQAAACGELVAWRISSDGVQWYKRVSGQPAEYPDIQAVPDGFPEVSADDDAGFDEPAGLDDFERASLQDWADQLRQGAADDNVVSDDDTEGADDDPE